MITRAITYNNKVLKFSDQTLSTNIAVIDVDGNIYHSIVIGNQEWLTENLKTTRYRNGMPISNITDGPTWYADTSGAYCWYDNDISYKEPYGALYNWYVTNSSHGLAPVGWKIPHRIDIENLITQIGGQGGAGGKLKEKGFDHWDSPNDGAIDSYEFKALGTGCRFGTFGWFAQLKTHTFFWCDTEFLELGTYKGDTLNITTDSSLGFWGADFKSTGFSIRCMRYVNYPEVTIGTQTWAKFNYDTSGTYPNNDITNVQRYGTLLTWDQANAINMPGWRLPTLTDLSTLINYVGGFVTGGAHLKESGAGHWAEGNGADNNTSFSALGAGENESSFKQYGTFWSSTEASPTYAFNLHLIANTSTANTDNSPKTQRFSVRLIKNN